MTEPVIKPRIDEDVPLCDAGCPQAEEYGSECLACLLDGEVRHPDFPAECCCPVHVKRMAALLREISSRSWIDARLTPGDMDEIRALLGGK